MNSEENRNLKQFATTLNFPGNYRNYYKRQSKQLADNQSSEMENFEQRDQLQESLSCLHSPKKATSETRGLVCSQYFQLSESVARNVNDELCESHQNLRAPAAIFQKAVLTSNEPPEMGRKNVLNAYSEWESHNNLPNQNLSQAERETPSKNTWIFNDEHPRPATPETILFRDQGKDYNVQATNNTQGPDFVRRNLDPLLSHEERKRLGESVGSGCSREKLENTLLNSVSLPFQTIPANNESERRNMILDMCEEQETATSIQTDAMNNVSNRGLIAALSEYSYLNPRHGISNKTYSDAHELQLEIVQASRPSYGTSGQKMSEGEVSAQANSIENENATFEDVYHRAVSDLNSSQSKYQNYSYARRIPPRNTSTQKRSRKKERQLEIIRRNLGYDEKGNPLPGTFICPDPYCKKLFGCQQSRSRHVALQHRQKKKEFTCTICKQSYVSKENLHKHTGNCHDPKLPKLSCDRCSAHFSSGFCLQAHKNSAHVQKKSESKETRKICYVCPICQETALEENNMYRHIRLVHIPSDGKRFMCNECGVRKNTKSNLKAHINTVHRKNEFR